MKATLLFIVSLLGHQWKMPVSHRSLRRRNTLKSWVYLQHLKPLTARLMSSSAGYAADQEAPPDESADITHFGWIIQNDIPIPAVAQDAPAPPELVDVIRCQCRAQGKQCMWLPQAAPCMHIMLQLLWWRTLL